MLPAASDSLPLIAGPSRGTPGFAAYRRNSLWNRSLDIPAGVSDVLTSELDEQGLQVAALKRAGDPHVVALDEVSICSPFPPHLAELGSCGAHFVGLNARHLPWTLNGRPAVDYIEEHWLRHSEELYGRVGIAPV